MDQSFSRDSSSSFADRSSGHREDYWRELYEARTYAYERSYEQLRPAYLLGWRSRESYGGRAWDEIEAELAREWEIALLSGGLPWAEVRWAVRDAWARAGAVSGRWSGYDQPGYGYGSRDRSRSRSDEGGGWGGSEESYGGGFSRGYGQQSYGGASGGAAGEGYGGGYGERFGGAATGGQEYGTSRGTRGGSPWQGQGPYSGRGPIGYQRSSERVREELGELLTRHGQVDASRIEIKVDNGEVTLEGSVQSRSQKRLAEAVAESVSGVRDIHNRLRVQPVPEEPASPVPPAPPALSTDPTFSAGSPPPGPSLQPAATPDAAGTTGVPTSSYALLDCPESVVAEVEFPLVVGISPLPMVPGDEPLDVPPTPGYVLVVHVIAEGFRLRDGESERHELAVTHENPYPTVVLHLTAQPQDIPYRLRRIRANYSVGGQAIGFSDRPLVVVESAELLASQIPRRVPRPGTIHLPTAGTAPDLTLTIRLGDAVGDLLWTLESPHAIELPERRLESNIGDDPERFARGLVKQINAREGKTGLYHLLVGIGRTVADEVPVKVWKALRAVAAKCGGTPDVLILSQEPYVPWELAVMPGEPLDPEAPHFLAAQVNVGRWVIRKDAGEDEDGEVGGILDRPRLPPPAELAVEGLAVVSGVYSSGKLQRLEEAEREAAELAQLYPAASVNADFEKVTGCLRGVPKADMLHFAVHGVYNPEGVDNGLLLVDQRSLHPFDVRGMDLTRAPFVFLNACQVGSGDQILGGYTGLAEAFLYAGASGVIAPLWSVKDTLARKMALDFYRGIAAGETPASLVRAARAQFKDADELLSATYLAYQFFGHPQLKLTGLRPRESEPS